MNLTATELAVFGTLGGALIGGLFSFITAFFSKRSEERQHFRELVVNTAASHWRNVAEISSSQRMPPLTDYIVHTVKMCDLALSNKLTAENVKEKLEEISTLMDILTEHANSVSVVEKNQIFKK